MVWVIVMMAVYCYVSLFRVSHFIALGTLFPSIILPWVMPTVTSCLVISRLICSLFIFLCSSSQLYASLEFGRKWQLVHEHVNRFYWWVIHLSSFFLLIILRFLSSSLLSWSFPLFSQTLLTNCFGASLAIVTFSLGVIHVYCLYKIGRYSITSLARWHE
jgi:hypothetical protein